MDQDLQNIFNIDDNTEKYYFFLDFSFLILHFQVKEEMYLSGVQIKIITQNLLIMPI